MSHIGMHQPKQKDGKNWEVTYSIVGTDGLTREGSKQFRVREDAQRFINSVKATATYSSGKMTISKIEG